MAEIKFCSPGNEMEENIKAASKHKLTGVTGGGVCRWESLLAQCLASAWVETRPSPVVVETMIKALALRENRAALAEHYDYEQSAADDCYCYYHHHHDDDDTAMQNDEGSFDDFLSLSLCLCLSLSALSLSLSQSLSRSHGVSYFRHSSASDFQERIESAFLWRIKVLLLHH